MHIVSPEIDLNNVLHILAAMVMYRTIAAQLDEITRRLNEKGVDMTTERKYGMVMPFSYLSARMSHRDVR